RGPRPALRCRGTPRPARRGWRDADGRGARKPVRKTLERWGAPGRWPGEGARWRRDSDRGRGRRLPCRPLSHAAFMRTRYPSTAVTETFDLAAVAYARWKRAVDLLVREVVRRREAQAREEERARTERRVRSLRRIVRRALSEYSRIQIARQ